MQELISWMQDNSITQTRLAELLGKTQPTISSFINGKTRISPDDARVLIDFSRGKLTWDCIYPPKPKRGGKK